MLINSLERLILYFVIYDLSDNLCYYLNDTYELSYVTGIRHKDINYRFKNRKFIKTIIDDKIYKVYKFFEG